MSLFFDMLQDLIHRPFVYFSVYFFFFYFLLLFYFLIVPPLPISNLPLLSYCSHSFQTFDLLFFTCHETSSNIIKFLQFSPYSHVSMIVRIRDSLFVWEADNHTDISRPGVDLIPLHYCLSSYPSNYFAVQKLIIPPYLLRFATRRLFSFIRRHRGKNFKYSLKMFFLNLIKIGRSINSSFTSVDSSFFCSELLAFTYKYCGLMHHLYPNWMYSPGDFYHNRAFFKSSISYGDFIPFTLK